MSVSLITGWLLEGLSAVVSEELLIEQRGAGSEEVGLFFLLTRAHP